MRILGHVRVHDAGPARPRTGTEARSPSGTASPSNGLLERSTIRFRPSRVTGLTRPVGDAGHLEPLRSCPYLDLPSSWEEYLASLSPDRRQTLRRQTVNFYQSGRDLPGRLRARRRRDLAPPHPERS